ERGVRREAAGDISRAGAGLDAGQAAALVLEVDAAGAGVGQELLDVPLGDAHVAGTGVDVHAKRLHLAHGHVSRAHAAMDAVAAETGQVAVAAAGVAGVRPARVARSHVARAGVRLDLPLDRRDRDVAAPGIEQNLPLQSL